jgi:hypothetical protein
MWFILILFLQCFHASIQMVSGPFVEIRVRNSHWLLDQPLELLELSVDGAL